MRFETDEELKAERDRIKKKKRKIIYQAVKNWRKNNPEKHKNLQRNDYMKHRDKYLERSKEYYQRNKTSILKKHRDWYLQNREAISAKRKLNSRRRKNVA
jgi:GT2 family glycosyltransferase